MTQQLRQRTLHQCAETLTLGDNRKYYDDLDRPKHFHRFRNHMVLNHPYLEADGRQLPADHWRCGSDGPGLVFAPEMDSFTHYSQPLDCFSTPSLSLRAGLLEVSSLHSRPGTTAAR
jgi:hypothetical protein